MQNSALIEKDQQGRVVSGSNSETVSRGKSETATNACPSPLDFVRIEKNLASLGFFTPSHKKIKEATRKEITFCRLVGGEKVRIRAVIHPSATYGLPINADQDKFFALLRIINEIQRKKGSIENPIGFTSAELLRTLGLRVEAGKNYSDILEWGRRMTLTGICSEGMVYFAGRKSWASDTFHVFERFVSVGSQMPDGNAADRNYVWLSEWQLENINSNFLIPIDFDAYKKLKNHIAKALVPLLQIWLFASRANGFFEKRYGDLCSLLNITQYRHLSKIKEKLQPSLDELAENRFLANWKIQPTQDNLDFKVLFYHGEKMFEGRTNKTESIKDSICAHSVDKEAFSALMRRGIREQTCREILSNLKPGQEVMDQIEWGDALRVASPPGKFINPPGLYIYLIRENIIPPEYFETSQQRRIHEASQLAREQAEQDLAQQQLAYWEYKKQMIEGYIKSCIPQDEYRRRIREKAQHMLRDPQWKRIVSINRHDTLDSMAERQVKGDLTKEFKFMTLAEFTEFQKTKDEILPWELGVAENVNQTPELSEIQIAGDSDI
jgi:hypothetical protein